MVYRNFPIRSFAWLAIGLGLGLGGCVAYGPSAGYPASPYGYYGDYYGYAYPPGFAYAPGFFGSTLDFGAERRFRHDGDEGHRERERARAEHSGHGPTTRPPGPVHIPPGGRAPALSGRTTPPHTPPQGHGTARGDNDGNHGRPRP